MKISEVNPSIIGRRVSCVENGTRVTGTIIGISEDKYTLNVRIKFDEPLHCWSGDFNVEDWYEDEYDSWARKCDGWGNLQNTYFIDSLEWLKDYQPKNAHYTDEFEMKEIADNLGLAKKSPSELQTTRNVVVAFYDELIYRAIEAGDSQKRYDYCTAMMSVTAVIDCHKWNRGMEV